MLVRTTLVALSLTLVACEKADPAPAEPVKQAEPEKPAEPAKPAEPEPAPKGPPEFMSEPERLDREGQPHADHERRTIDIAGLARRGGENAKVVVVGCIDPGEPYSKRGQQNWAEALAAFPNDVAMYIHPYWTVNQSVDDTAKRGNKDSIARIERTKFVAAALVAADQQGKIWEMHDLVLATERDQITRENLGKLEGLDVAKWTAALDSEETKTAVAAHKQACNALGVDRGIPVYFINGRMMMGARLAEDLRYLVEVEIWGGFEKLPKNESAPKPPG